MSNQAKFDRFDREGQCDAKAAKGHQCRRSATGLIMSSLHLGDVFRNQRGFKDRPYFCTFHARYPWQEPHETHPESYYEQRKKEATDA